MSYGNLDCGPIVKWYYGSMAWISAGFDSPWVHHQDVAEGDVHIDAMPQLRCGATEKIKINFMDDKPKKYREDISQRIYSERKRWLWRVFHLAQEAYQSLTRLPEDHEAAIRQEKVLQREADDMRVATYRLQENLKNEDIPS
jgi:hypothetical protein